MKLLKVRISIVVLVVVATIALLLVLKLNYKKEGVGDQVGHAQSSMVNAVDKSTPIKPINQETTEKPTAKLFLESLTKPKTPVVANENVDEKYSTMLNVALTGDLEKAVKISSLQTECDTLLFRKTLLNNTYIRNSEGMLESEIEQEMTNQRNIQHNKFEKDVRKCMDAFNGDYDSKLGKLARHDELYQQALAGNAMAKFIYATQVHSDPYITEMFIQDIDFEAEALAFTNENLIAHPYLGLLMVSLILRAANSPQYGYP